MLRNIIIVNDFAFINGGAAKVAIESAIGLAGLGYHVTFFAAVGPIDDRLEQAGIRVVCLGQRDILSDPNRIRAIFQGLWNEKIRRSFNKLLSEYEPYDTVIHIHGWIKALSPSFWLTVANNKIKPIITLHDYFLFCPNGGLFNYQKKEICHLKPCSFSCYKNNCDSRNYLQKLWRSIRQVIFVCVFNKVKDLSVIYISELNKSVSLPILKCKTDRWFYVNNPVIITNSQIADITKNNVYLFIGRLSSEKGIELFCEAITELGLNGEVLGDGPLRAEMEKKYPKIHFKGWQSGENLKQYILRSKTLVFPSLWYEGAPLTIIEMLSYGIPCIVPDQCAASEEIIDAKNGFVFKTGNLQSLKQAITKMENSNPIELQSSIDIARIKEECSLKRHCGKLIECYNQILRTINS